MQARLNLEDSAGDSQPVACSDILAGGEREENINLVKSRGCRIGHLVAPTFNVEQDEEKLGFCKKVEAGAGGRRSNWWGAQDSRTPAT